MNVANQTDLITIHNLDYTPVIIICSLSGAVTLAICVFYCIAFYRYYNLDDLQKRSHYYTASDLVCRRKVGSS